ncbi:hypothetical protein V2J09_007345 [Rumex salicifolius]
MVFRTIKRLFKSSLTKDSRRHQTTNPTAADEADTLPEIDDDKPTVSGLMVELYSSQGCPTSPEAEVLISRLRRGDFQLAFPVTVLAFHVDYWNYMGWKDPYGSSAWTVRQKAYVEALQLDTLFTPQIVVQGRSQCVGNDEEALLSAISEAPKFPSPTFRVTFERPSVDTLQVTLKGSLRSQVDDMGVNVMVALHESGLMTSCPSGENKDRILSNDFVVRRLERLCFVEDASPKKTLSGTISFTLWERFSANKTGLSVFAQNNSHHIFGCQNIVLPHDV